MDDENSAAKDTAYIKQSESIENQENNDVITNENTAGNELETETETETVNENQNQNTLGTEREDDEDGTTRQEEEDDNDNEDERVGHDNHDADENNNVSMEDLNTNKGGMSTDGSESLVNKDGDVNADVPIINDDNDDNDGKEDGDQPQTSNERPASAPTPYKGQGDGEDNLQGEQADEHEAASAADKGQNQGQDQSQGQEDQQAPQAPGTASTLKVKSGIVRKHTTTPADDSGLDQPILPAIPRGQVKVHHMASSSISDARRKDVIGQPQTLYPIRNRVPPKLVRLATVTVSPAKARPAPHGPSLYYEEPRRPQKVITWDQANNARPPLRVDMEGPGPCSYSPLNKPLNETNAPCYSFGTKCFPEKPAGVGSRTSWGKSWFQSNHPYHQKADYVREGLWPSPTHYPKPKTLGARQKTMYEAPSYTFGHKAEFSLIKAGAHKEPSPTDYERQIADRQILKRGPSFSHQFRREGTVLWGCSESNPGPAAYTPTIQQRQQKPAYTIQGIRRSKSHILGPFSSM